MRRGNENTELYTDDGKLMAISLGSDYCAEHEWGIKRIIKSLGIGLKAKLAGVTVRTITKSDLISFLLLNKNGTLSKQKNRKHTKAILYLTPYPSEGPNIKYLTRELTSYDKEKEFVCAWSESDFGIMAHTPEAVVKLKELHQAFVNHDVAIWMGSNGGNPFRRSQLCMGIVSRLSDDILDAMNDADKEEAVA